MRLYIEPMFDHSLPLSLTDQLPSFWIMDFNDVPLTDVDVVEVVDIVCVVNVVDDVVDGVDDVNVVDYVDDVML